MDRKISKGNSTLEMSNFKRRIMALAVLMSATVVNGQPEAICPKECFCRYYYHPEDGPALRVACSQGGMHSIPVDRLQRDIHQLIISPPLDEPNFLTIGPVLTQPAPFSNLRDLTIANSNVPSIGQYSFWGLQNLRTLNLTRNNITTISMDNFRGLIYLTFLYLDHNSIEHMPSETFRHLPALKRLFLSHNKISALVPRIFRMLGKLTSLDLSYNPLNELNPEVFKDIQRLLVFKCRRCFLRRVNAQIYHLAPLIEELDLGENLFKYLTADEFMNLKKLRRLQLDGNQLSVIVDHVFRQNLEMQILDLARNRLALLAPGSLTNLSSLTNLDISYNKIEKFHLQVFASAVNSLRCVDLSGNNLPLNEIAILLQILPNLQGVGLANLSLNNIPPNFFMYNERLMTLDISSNKLTTFPYAMLRKTRRLQYLDISHNQIETLNELDLHRLEAIPEINLSNNAWNCDQCSVGSMLTYMKTTVLNGTLRQLKCHTPLQLRGERFAHLTYDHLDACPSSYEAQVSVIAGLVLVMMAVLAAMAAVICCKHRRGAHYYTNEEKRRERAHDHPEELVPHTENSSVATIHAPYQHGTNCS